MNKLWYFVPNLKGICTDPVVCGLPTHKADPSLTYNINTAYSILNESLHRFAMTFQFWLGKISANLNPIKNIPKFHIASAHLTNFRIHQIIDLGTKYTLSIDCRLDRRNPQFPGVLYLSSKSKISRFNFLVGFIAQSEHREKNLLRLAFCPFFHPVRL